MKQVSPCSVCLGPEGRITGLSKGWQDHLVGIQVYQYVLIDES